MRMLDAIRLVVPHIPWGITDWSQCRYRADIAARAGVSIGVLDAVERSIRRDLPQFPLVSHNAFGLGFSTEPAMVADHLRRRAGYVLTVLRVEEANLMRHIESQALGLTLPEQRVVKMAFSNAVTAGSMVALPR